MSSRNVILFYNTPNNLAFLNKLPLEKTRSCCSIFDSKNFSQHKIMEIFKDEAKQEQSIPPAIPVLPRLDRLDRLLQLLEEKHNLSGRYSTGGSDLNKIREKKDDGESKSLSSVLEEVREKGTLMDRINMLENRVMQLSLVMDERNSSRSSSSTTGHSNIVSDVQNVAGQGKDETVTCLDKQDSQEETESKGKKQRRSRSRKWSGWYRLGC